MAAIKENTTENTNNGPRKRKSKVYPTKSKETTVETTDENKVAVENEAEDETKTAGNAEFWLEPGYDFLADDKWKGNDKAEEYFLLMVCG